MKATTIRARAASLSVLSLLAAACASDGPAGEGDTRPGEPGAPRSSIPEDATIVKDTISGKAAPSLDDAEFVRQLASVDARIGEHERLATSTGQDASERRELVRSALEASVAQYFERFLAAVSDPSEPMRRRISARALAFSKDRRATPALVSALAARDDADLRTNAAFALARIADPDTPLPGLLDAASDADREVRTNSLLALWHLLVARRDAGRPPDAATRDTVLPVLEASLFDPDAPIARGNAAAAMGALGDARGVDPLLNLLRDKHAFVRMHTALALGRLGDRRAIQPLVAAVDETPRGSTRSAVGLAIAMLLEREGVAVPEPLPDDGRAWTSLVQRLLPARR